MYVSLRLVPLRLCAVLLALMPLSCTAPQVGSLCSTPQGVTSSERSVAACLCGEASRGQIQEAAFSPHDPWKIDVLLVVSNGPGMARKQQALSAKLSVLARQLSETLWTGYDYHIGVVTTDVGSWAAPGQPWPISAGACDSYRGDDGALQAVSCWDRDNLSAAARQACAETCPDRRFVPTGGARYLSNTGDLRNVPGAREIDPKTGQTVDRGLEYTLRCTAMVGDGGCAMTSPLEAARRALDGHLRENDGFLRPGVELIVLFVTDEDDCSVSAARRTESSPVTQDCAAPDFQAPPACFNQDFRCTGRSIVCDQPLNVPGTKTGCHERASSFLEPVETYVRFFQTLPLKRYPAVRGLWPLPSFGGTGQLVVERDPAVPGSAGLRLGSGPDAACRLSSDPAATGAAQLRLSRFMKLLDEGRPQGFPSRSEYSLCDETEYLEALSWPVLAIGLEPPCIETPKQRADGSWACMVGDVPAASRHAAPEKLLPACSTRCCEGFARAPMPIPGTVPVDEACESEPADCRCITPSRAGACPWGVVLGVWRAGHRYAPAGTDINVRCAGASSACQ